MRSGEVLSCLSKERVHELAKLFDVPLLRSNESAKSLASGIARSLGARLGWLGSLQKVLATLTPDELRVAIARGTEVLDVDGNAFPLYRPSAALSELNHEELSSLVSDLPAHGILLSDHQAVDELKRLIDSPRWRRFFEYTPPSDEPRNEATTALGPFTLERIDIHQKTRALRVLETQSLRDLVEGARRSVPDWRNRRQMLDVLVELTSPFSKLITPLSRDDLKGMCRALGLPEDGREKAILVQRICDPQIAASPAYDDERSHKAFEVLSLLRREELQEAVDDLGIRAIDRRSGRELANVIVEAKVPLAPVLEKLPRPRLKEICRVLDVDDSGREKITLVRRIAGDLLHEIAPPTRADEAHDTFDNESASLGRTNLLLLQRALAGVVEIEDAGSFWPARGRVVANGQELPVEIYARVIGGTGRDPEERRFQNPPELVIKPRVGYASLLLGLWLERGDDRAVFVAFDAYRRADKHTRFSLFMPLTLLEKAADTGFATHTTASGETLYAFRPDGIARYLDVITERAPLTERDGSRGPAAKQPSAAPLSTVDVGVESVEIRPKAGMFGAFARLNYKPWFALAELVDNAVQSFLSNRSRLEATGMSGPLVVDINVDSEEISVTDRAAGIPLKDFPRAFSPATPPPDAAGLSEFGLGMKASASWFAREWSVRTSALGEPIERTIFFDVPRITREGLDSLPIETREARVDDHYTVVTMHNLRVKPKGATIGKIKDHLASIYRLLIADGTVRLRWSHAGKAEDLGWEQPRLLQAPFYKDRNGPPVLWRKEIAIDLQEGRRVTGWVGIMEIGKHSRAGLSVFRRNRLIEGSVGEAYRPRQVFGAHNSFASQRLVGELYVEGFDVSHTKDGIQWGDYEEDVAYELRLALSTEDMPMLEQAEGYRSRRTAAQLPSDFGEKAIDAVAIAAEGDEIGEAIAEHLNDPPVEDEPPATSFKQAEATLQQKMFRIQVPGTTPWDVRIELTKDAAPIWLDCAQVQTPQGEVLQVRINLDHEFSIEHINDNQKVLEPVLLLAVAIGIAEREATAQGVKNVGTLRRRMNELLRRGLAKAQMSALLEVDQ